MSYLSKVVLLFHHSIIFSISDNITVTCRASTLQWRSPNLLGTVEPTLNMRPVPNLSPLPMTWPSPVSVSLKSVSFRNCCSWSSARCGGAAVVLLQCGGQRKVVMFCGHQLHKLLLWGCGRGDWLPAPVTHSTPVTPLHPGIVTSHTQHTVTPLHPGISRLRTEMWCAPVLSPVQTVINVMSLRSPYI